MPNLTFSAAVSRLRALDTQAGNTAFEQGDIARDLYVLNDDPGIRLLAEAAGLTYTMLRQRHLVSSTIAPTLRRANVAWAAYREIARIESGDERLRLLRMVLNEEPTTESKRWTVNAVLERAGKPLILHTGEALSVRLERAPVAEKAAVYESLRSDPRVRQEVVRQREALPPLSPLPTPRPDPVAREIDAAQALTDLEDAMEAFVLKVVDVFPRVTRMPDPTSDPWARSIFMRQLVARSRGALDQIESLLNTGSPSGDIDNFMREVLATRKGGNG